ncbi:MAG: hypothetical protein ACXWL5_02630 [Candidatus Chromulinivorax sp.]
MRFFVMSCLWYLFFCFQYVDASNYGPELIFHKPFLPDKEVGSLFMNLSGGKTNKGFNRHGAVVPFLQEYGSEDLLLRFIDPLIPNTDVTKLGTINFSGNLSLTRLNLHYVKNICSDLFFAIGTVPQNLTAGDISMDITLDHPLSDNQERLLDIFKSKIPADINVSGLLTTYMELGYNKKWKSFKNIEHLHFSVIGTIGTPQWVNGRHANILQYPLAGNLAFNYPLTTILQIGLTERLHLGVYGSMISFQPVNGTFPVHIRESNNHVLLDEYVKGSLHIGRIFATDIYVEWNHIFKNISALLGYGAIIGNHTKVVPISQLSKNEIFMNVNPIFSGWYTSSVFLQFSCPFVKEGQAEALSTHLFLVLPLAGKYYPKMNVIGGSVGFLFNYKF